MTSNPDNGPGGPDARANGEQRTQDGSQRPAAQQNQTSRDKASLVVRPLADITAQPVDSLWPGWLARGKFHLLGGMAGDGKSTLAAYFAAVGSNGGRWPDGSQAPHFRTLFMLGEDAFDDTLRPRLDLHGANVDEIFALEAVRDENGRERFFDIERHLELLENAVIELNIDLVIIDPLTTFMAGRDRNAEGGVRDSLTPLVKLGQRQNVALVGIAHVGKPNGTDRNAMQRLLGATAFVALARAVWQTARVDDEMMALGVTKANLSKKPPALLWTRREDGPITWHGESDQSIDDLMRAGGAPAPRQKAEEFLVEFLADGPRPATEVRQAAQERDITKRTLDRAKGQMQVESIKDEGPHGQWLWRLPDGEQGAKVQVIGGRNRGKDANTKVVDLAPLASLRAEDAS